MDCSEDFSLLNALDVCPVSYGPRSSRSDTESSSGGKQRRRRWRPYNKRRKLLPKKSFSLEMIPLLPDTERSQCFELTQSTEDQTLIKSESNIDLDNDYSIVPELVQGLLPTLEDDFSMICLETDYRASTSQNITECLHCSVESELTFEHICHTDTQTSPPTVKPVHSTTEPPDTSYCDDSSVITKPGQSLTEWLLWSAYAKLMKLAWRNVRKNLNEQTHQAEYCELQAKTTMRQIYSMKTQLKADISEMKENVMKIQSMRAILDSAEEDESRLQTKNNNLKVKIENLNEERSKLRQEISKAVQTIGEFQAEAESAKAEIKIWDDEVAVLEAEMTVLDEEIQELTSLTEQADENVTTGRKNVFNRQLEINGIEQELTVSKEKNAVGLRMLQTVREQAQATSKEIFIATEEGEAAQKQLAETRKKVMNRESVIAELSAKVASAEKKISTIKESMKTSEMKSFWRRFQFLPKDSPSLFSIKLWD